jgi:carboxyl-terminal processing protease
LSFEKSIQEESKDQEALAQIKILNQKIQASKENDLEKYRNEIEEVLEGEIAARYYFQKGRIESTFNDDAEITEALKVLKNPSLYQSIIKGEGSFKTIGKPEDKSQTENTASKDSDISPEEAIDE